MKLSLTESQIINEVIKFFLNLIGTKNTYRFVITGVNYSRLEIFWGMIVIEKGDKREIAITGTEKYINYFIKRLEKEQFKVKKLLK